MNYDIPLELLQSPVTRTPLKLEGKSLVDASGNRFDCDTENGFWDFMPQSSPLYTSEEWNTFQTLISNFLISYSKDPKVNVSYEYRDDAAAFGRFCQFHGAVLDIGCGPHKVPSYISHNRPNGVTFYGVDVVPGEHPKQLVFARAMGEHLPFKNGAFNVSVSGTSLLHYINVKAGVEEALRVVSPGGYACIWIGVKSPSAPLPAVSPDWYKALGTPEGAENPFHFKRYEETEFEKILTACGVTILDKEIHLVDEWRRNVFYRLKKA